MFTLYKDIALRINELNPEEISAETPARIVTIDIYNGQFDTPENAHEINYPAVYIDLVEADWSDLAGGVQIADKLFIEVLIGIRIDRTTHLTNGSTNTFINELDISINKLQLINDVHKKLDGWATTYSGSFTRKKTVREKSLEGIKVFTMIYECSGIDESAVPEVGQTIPRPELKVKTPDSSVVMKGSRD
jgi:hypothetical protein